MHSVPRALATSAWFEVNTPGNGERDYTWTVGIRNSHDKTYLAWSAITCRSVARCASAASTRVLQRGTCAILQHVLPVSWEIAFTSSMSASRLTGHGASPIPQAHDLVIKAVDCRAIKPTQVPDVLHEWREPEHDDSSGRGMRGACSMPAQKCSRASTRIPW